LIVVSLLSTDDLPAFHLEVNVDGEPVELLVAGEIAGGPAEYESSPRLVIDRDHKCITILPDDDSMLGRIAPGVNLHVLTSTPDAVAELAGDELLFHDRMPRYLPYFALRTRSTRFARWTFLGSTNQGGPPIGDCERLATPSGWRPASSATGPIAVGGLAADVRLSAGQGGEPLEAIQDALAWFARDAVVDRARRPPARAVASGRASGHVAPAVRRRRLG
jgi:hypothetical protein